MGSCGMLSNWTKKGERREERAWLYEKDAGLGRTGGAKFSLLGGERCVNSRTGR